jgi:hypothetical protein
MKINGEIVDKYLIVDCGQIQSQGDKLDSVVDEANEVARQNIDDGEEESTIFIYSLIKAVVAKQQTKIINIP